jgi:hypothetical protein
MSYIMTFSITQESWENLQGTQRGWFQWGLSDSQFDRIKPVDSIDALLKRHEVAQKLGIEHVVIIESGKSNILQQLIAEEKNDIKIIFRNRFPADTVNLLCEPDAEILETWATICQGKTFKNNYFPTRSLAEAYGIALNNWLNNTLDEDDLVNYIPVSNHIFSAEEFTYIGTENKTCIFALTDFSSAWLTLAIQKNKIANYAGAFIQAPKLHQEYDWDKLDHSFWTQWLNQFPQTPKKEFISQSSSTSQRKSWREKITEKMLSLEGMILESAIGTCSDKSITVTKEIETPYTEDDEGNTLELYQDREGIWKVSFYTVHQKVKEIASVIISGDEQEKTVIQQKLRYRDGGWQFDEPLSKLLEGHKGFTYKPSLTVKYSLKDEEQ